MSTMISEAYDAFVSAGAPEEKARKAAEALSGQDGHVVKIEAELVVIHGELALLKWMLGLALILLSAVALRLFMH
ncbi:MULTISPECIES: hypothetical protein [Methylosinus]|uniref:Integrase n=1 Tax=Methylosinus trichosporium (strain ATCC 35070 / NCIMB 11131 / UNIQEM 75 / OB3b) TaxID=595536 RepID=A0A2D2D5C3_METT3|nr:MULTISPECIES: hypothetical protein [Methylosinus]ATQ70227.1 integrase [Methylosinus trichosporium OB3b]OBS52586.1 hypothetical protein A8B73_10435 [Methylosinus sp. 3S-1]